MVEDGKATYGGKMPYIRLGICGRGGCFVLSNPVEIHAVFPLLVFLHVGSSSFSPTYIQLV
jgi:hypothetical protein